MREKGRSKRFYQILSLILGILLLALAGSLAYSLYRATHERIDRTYIPLEPSESGYEAVTLDGTLTLRRSEGRLDRVFRGTLTITQNGVTNSTEVTLYGLAVGRPDWPLHCFGIRGRAARIDSETTPNEQDWYPDAIVLDSGDLLLYIQEGDEKAATMVWDAAAELFFDGPQV